MKGERKDTEKEPSSAVNNLEETTLRWLSYYKGKIEIGLKAPVWSYDDFAIWYTPSVAEPSREIKNSRKCVFKYTNEGNSVAIVRILSEKANSFGILHIHLILLGDVIYIPNFNKLSKLHL